MVYSYHEPVVIWWCSWQMKGVHVWRLNCKYERLTNKLRYNYSQSSFRNLLTVIERLSDDNNNSLKNWLNGWNSCKKNTAVHCGFVCSFESEMIVVPPFTQMSIKIKVELWVDHAKVWRDGLEHCYAHKGEDHSAKRTRVQSVPFFQYAIRVREKM